MATQKKIDTVQELTDKMAKAKVMVVTDYRGLKHKQLETLRKSLKAAQGEFMIAKNTLILRALGEKADLLKDSLKDSSAVLFSYADEVAPLAEMLKFFKTAGVGKTRKGLMGETVMTEEDVTRLASLPSRTTLLGRLVGQLNAPIQGLHYALSWNINKLVWALDSIREKKG